MHKMETKRQTESVLAKLMGLEGPLPSKSLRHGRKRVLSASYLQDIALICQHKKWSFDRFSMDGDVRMLERRDSSQDLQSSSSSSSSEEFLERYRIEDILFQKLWLLNSIQNSKKKIKSPKKMESVSQTTMRSVLQNEKKAGNTHYVQLVSSNVGKPEIFSDTRKKRTYLGKREREAHKHSSMARHGIAKQVAKDLQHSTWHDYIKEIGPVNTKDEIISQNPHVVKHRFPGNMNTSNSKVGHGKCILNSPSFPSSRSLKCRNKNFSVHKDWCLDLVSEGSSYCNSMQKGDYKSEEDLIQRNSSSIIELHSEKDVTCKEISSTTSDLSKFGERHLFDEIHSIPESPKEISTCSDVENLSSKNKECVNVDDISEKIVDDAFMPLHQEYNTSLLYQTEACKLNPDEASNLKDISTAAHFIATHGSESKFQQSTSTSFYPEAKRHKRIDVKDVEETIPGIYKTEQIQELSYLIDVLVESGLQCGSLETCYKLGQPLENPINPLVYDSLEKKYSKQPSWMKSDRKLLFDRINCALSDILCPITWRKHKRNKLLFHCNQDIIREELLSVLVNQEKEAKRVSSDKVVGIDCDWLELEEDMQIVTKEIEEFLIDELMEEIVSTELLI